jgi:hypothetical protein
VLTVFWLGDLKGIDNWNDLVVGGRIILTCTLGG